MCQCKVSLTWEIQLTATAEQRIHAKTETKHKYWVANLYELSDFVVVCSCLSSSFSWQIQLLISRSFSPTKEVTESSLCTTTDFLNRSQMPYIWCLYKMTFIHICRYHLYAMTFKHKMTGHSNWILKECTYGRMF